MILSDDNKIVHGLWVGNKLSTLEMLTLKSFVNNGHHFYLWTYNALENTLPPHVFLKDANEIIPEKDIFRRKYDDPNYHIGKGSIGSPFSDLFRYKLLYEYGGWWVDMDVTCLQPFSIDSPYFFRAHPLLPMIGNILKVPAKSELMRRTYEETLQTCDENTLEWLLPNKILNNHIEQLQLTNYIQDNKSVSDWWEQVVKYIVTNKKIPNDWLFIHWMNEEWRTRGLDKNKIYQQTTIGNLCAKYHEPTTSYPLLRKLWNTLKTLK
ncbi:MAG: hypothetical protein M9916_10420 [Crocinitomicaceae bacterium]|nr:hypothetical protein [Crocinitomicaceae bacterium]